jgi:hypothetical protein
MADNQENDQDQSIAELVKKIGEQAAALARMELELAEAEVTSKAKRAGIGAGMFGGAGLLGLFGLGSVTAAAIMALALAVPGWLSALIVGAIYGGLAATMALTGAVKVKRAAPPLPEQAAEGVRQDVESLKSRAQAARG